MANTNSTTLGKVRDNSKTYAPGSHEVFVEFTMMGLRFKAHRFVRTDACPCARTYLYICPEGDWMTDLVKTITAESTNLSRVDHRALHLIDVALSTIPACTGERYAAIEMS